MSQTYLKSDHFNGGGSGVRPVRTLLYAMAGRQALVSKAAYFALWLAAYVVLGLLLAMFVQSLVNWLLG